MQIARIQSIANFVSGAWPILHLKSFEAVTGKKEDEWLVTTIGWLFILSGLQLWTSSSDKDAALIGIGWSAVIGGADIYYGGIKKRISRVYVLDALVQAVFIFAWLKYLWTKMKQDG